ncbi:hypothetical protein PAJL_491 [Cutibacterium acnes HL042PA3]|nr:hypothetical protein TIIST44_09710 [Cutibacterium acnes subsp. defendens ATCC 11828]ESK59900.1 hypothetical protein PAJL_491 [Cutibacterium acnes HL042PA3]MCW5114960.1 hypothetical protein [Cutibacterium acnes P05]
MGGDACYDVVLAQEANDAGVVATFSTLIMEAVPLNLKGVPVGDMTVVVNLCDGYHRCLT